VGRETVVALIEALGKVAPELCVGLTGPDGALWAMTPAAEEAGLTCGECDDARSVEVVVDGVRCRMHAAPSVRSGIAWRSPDVVDFHGLLTREPSMLRVIDTIRRVALSEVTVLLRGESGTGKEVLASAIHRESTRREGPFVAVNCASFSPGLLESELFGHVKGAFTGADRDRHGIFQQADGGTLFLDEVAEIPLDLQGRLLRVLQEQVFVPVGGTRPVKVDVRVVAATHKGLREEVKAGRFREDLMYRLRVVPVFIPPLRDRRLDLELLLHHHLDMRSRKGPRRVERVAPDAMRALLGHGWPGNVRELLNVIEYAFAVGIGPELGLGDLPPEFAEEAGEAAPAAADEERIREALVASGGDVAAAAKSLGISRTTLWRWRRRLGMEG
jgi:two-component system response regulator AtoC